jgi:hypothetical protein
MSAPPIKGVWNVRPGMDQRERERQGGGEREREREERERERKRERETERARARARACNVRKWVRQHDSLHAPEGFWV